MGKVAHDSQQASDKESVAGVEEIWVDIAKAVAWPPRIHVVVMPDESKDDSEYVTDRYAANEDGCCELAVAKEESEWSDADDDGEEAQKDSHDEICCVIWVCEGWFIWNYHESWSMELSCCESMSHVWLRCCGGMKQGRG